MLPVSTHLPKMNSIIYVESSSLKEILVLFDPKMELENFILGDTWHPSSGYVDEKILNGKNKVSDLLEFDYNFMGLVEFQAHLGAINIRLLNTDTDDNYQEYLIEGEAKHIEAIRNKLIEANALQTGKYKFSAKIEYNGK
jgi:hypothetical protein